MTEKALAAVAVAPYTTEVQAFPFPESAPDAGLLRVEAVGVCGTDVSYYRKLSGPRILGHHVVGYIEQVGREAAARWGVRPGDRVAMEEYIPCGQCAFCRTGEYRACPRTDPRGGGIRYGATPITVAPALYGGFARYMYLHPNAVLHHMPAHVPAVEAALTLPLANGFEWMSLLGGVGPGKAVVIQGPGQQGLACALAAKAAGSDCVIVTGRNSSLRRLQLAKELGADHVINVSEESMVERVREMTGGKMADLVLDVTSGGTEPVTSSLEVAARGATVLLGAYKNEGVPQFPVDTVVAKTLMVRGVRGHSFRSVRMAVDCIASGRFPLRLMGSHKYGLNQVDQALRTAGGEGEPNPLLVTVSPWQ